MVTNSGVVRHRDAIHLRQRGNGVVGRGDIPEVRATPHARIGATPVRVITSYSIHYTKLYDGQPVPGFIRLVVVRVVVAEVQYQQVEPWVTSGEQVGERVALLVGAVALRGRRFPGLFQRFADFVGMLVRVSYNFV